MIGRATTTVHRVDDEEAGLYGQDVFGDEFYDEPHAVPAHASGRRARPASRLAPWALAIAVALVGVVAALGVGMRALGVRGGLGAITAAGPPAGGYAGATGTAGRARGIRRAAALLRHRARAVARAAAGSAGTVGADRARPSPGLKGRARRYVAGGSSRPSGAASDESSPAVGGRAGAGAAAAAAEFGFER